MPEKNSIYDVVIVGGGPAGITAAIYTARKALKTLIVAKALGGQVFLTSEIENYPGFDFISGPDLVKKFKAQIDKLKVEQESVEIDGINKTKDGFVVKSGKRQFKAKAVILAFGLTPRSLGVPGEKELSGRGVSYCDICDGPFFKNKIVAVVGGGNSAFEAAEYLSKIAKTVYLVHRQDKFRGDQILVDRVKKIKNVELVLSSEVRKINGKPVVASILVENNQTKEKQILKVDGIFIKVGYIAKTDWVGGLVKLNGRKEVIIDKDCQTSCPGIFAVGDVTDIRYKQIVISAGEGAKAGLQAYRYIQSKEDKPLAPDWGKRKS